ncbi:MAG: hypothetical protein IT232_06495 [Flavobacteriales bacterium]|nr:hypothetical protein [Flavobacteriales bacterium]
MEINEFEIVLNIRYDMHEEDWVELVQAFEQMPGWFGMKKNGVFLWFGTEDDEIYVRGKITYTGFELEANLPEVVWNAWLLQFIEKSSLALGIEITEV